MRETAKSGTCSLKNITGTIASMSNKTHKTPNRKKEKQNANQAGAKKCIKVSRERKSTNVKEEP